MPSYTCPGVPELLLVAADTCTASLALVWGRGKWRARGCGLAGPLVSSAWPLQTQRHSNNRPDQDLTASCTQGKNNWLMSGALHNHKN